MITDKLTEGIKVEYRPYEECRDSDKVQGTLIGSINDKDEYPVLMDWQKRKGITAPKYLDRYHLYLV